MKASLLRMFMAFFILGIWGESLAGTISGKITYAGSYSGQIFIVAFTDTTFSGKPTASVTLSVPGNYMLTGLSDGKYYIGSVLLTDTAKGLKLTDPYGGYGVGDGLSPVTLTGGGSVTGIDITLIDGTITKPNPFFKQYALPKQVTALPVEVQGGNNPVLMYDGSSMYMHRQDYSGAASGKMYKINPYSGVVSATYTTSLTSSPNGTSWIGSMTYHKGAIWVSGGYGDPSGAGGKVGVFKMDLGSSVSSNQLPVNSGIDAVAELGGIASDGTNLYVGATLLAGSSKTGVVKFNPSSVVEVPVSPFFALTYTPEYLCYGDGYLWAGYDAVKKIDPSTGAVLASYNFPRSAAAVYLDKMLWEYDESDNTLKAFAVTPTGVTQDKVVSIPISYSLSQNFPNPFNPSTVIRYDLPTAGVVMLKVYSILGKEVAELLNGYRPAGSYSVSFDASSLGSGVYFYTLKAGSFVETKRMAVVK